MEQLAVRSNNSSVESASEAVLEATMSVNETEIMKNKNNIEMLMSSYYGMMKLIYHILAFTPNFKDCPEGKVFWDKIIHEFSGAIKRAQVDMKSLNMVLQSFTLLGHKVQDMHSKLKTTKLSIILKQSYPSAKAVFTDHVPEAFNKIALLNKISLEECEKNFTQLLPLLGANAFIAGQQALEAIKAELEAELRKKDEVIKGTEYNAITTRMTNARIDKAKNEYLIKSNRVRMSELEKERDELIAEKKNADENKEAYLKQIGERMENADGTEMAEIKTLSEKEQAESVEITQRWMEKINHTETILNAISEKVRDPEGTLGTVKKVLNLAAPFLGMAMGFVGVAGFALNGFGTGDCKEPTMDELIKISETVEGQMKQYKAFLREELADSATKFAALTLRTRESYDRLRATAKTLKTDREAALNGRKKELADSLTAAKTLLEEKRKEQDNYNTALVSAEEALISACTDYEVLIQDSLAMRNKRIFQLRKDYEKQDENNRDMLRSSGQGTAEMAYHFFTAILVFNKKIQSSTTVAGGASNFVEMNLKDIKIHFENIDVLSTREVTERNTTHWSNLHKFLKREFSEDIKGTGLNVRRAFVDRKDEDLKKLFPSDEEMREVLKEEFANLYKDFLLENIDTDPDMKAIFMLNCRDLYNIFDFRNIQEVMDKMGE